MVTKWLKRMALSRSTKLLEGLLGVDEAVNFVQQLAGLKDFSEFSVTGLHRGAEVWSYLCDLEAANLAAKLAKKELEFVVSTANRQLYVPSLNLVLANRGGYENFRYSFSLESPGLMEEVVRDRMGPLSHPVSIQLVNELVDEDGDSVPMAESAMKALLARGYRVSKEKVAWHWDTVKDLFLRAFPKAVDFVAYNHRFRSPLVPGGFLKGQTAAFWPQTTLTADGQELPQGVDGSGSYDPLHPDAADLVARYGESVIQVTLFGADSGLVGKGILVPRPGLAAQTGIDCAWWPDLSMVKGSQKSAFADNEATVVTGLYLGVMKTWSKAATMAAGFEQVEHLGTTHCENRESARLRLAELIQRGVARDADKLLKGGLNGIVAQIAAEDEGVAAIAALLEVFASQGKRINPMDVKPISGAITDRLMRKLWPIATSAGVSGSQLVIVMDATVPEGAVVARGVKPGQKAACWRWPTILGCANLVLTGASAGPDHLDSSGEVIANAAFMNPQDVLRMQGDDDGDIIGLTTSPEAVELWSYTMDRTFYAIEPVGTKFDIATESDAGFTYGSRDPRGPVGRTTIWATELRAAGDHEGALALSVLNQEAIDMAKRRVQFTDPRLAAKRQNWKPCVDGKHHIHWATDGENYYPASKVPADVVITERSDNWLKDQDGTFPLKVIEAFVEGRLEYRKVFRKKKQSPIGWRKQFSSDNKRLKKRIDWTNWQASTDTQGGCTVRNAVHYSHDCARNVLQSRVAALVAEYDTEAPDLQMLLPDLVESLTGITVAPMSYDTYRADLHKRSGIAAFGEAMQKAMSIEDDEYKQTCVEAAFADLYTSLRELEIPELVAIWRRELTPCWAYQTTKTAQPVYVDDKALVPANAFKTWEANKPAHAYRAVAHPGSKLLALFGTKVTVGCKFLARPGKTGHSRSQEALAWALKQPDSVASLAKLVYTNTSHGEEVVDANGQAIPMHKCKTCQDTLQDQLVRHHRAQKKLGLTKAVKELTTEVNKLLKLEGPSKAEELSAL